MKKLKALDLKCLAAVIVAMAVIYIVTRYYMGNLYTPEWVARSLFNYILCFVTVLSLLGYRKFVSTAIAGYLAGLVAGEVFGGFESHIGPQYLHWGWLIFIVVFVVFCIGGFFIEKYFGKK